MKTVLRLALLLTFLASGILYAAQPAYGQTPLPVPPGCTLYTPNIVGGMPAPPFWLACFPASGWNGDVVVFADGYVQPGPITDFANLTLGNTSLPGLVLSQGYGFATTTYPKNGLAIVEGVQDVSNLVQRLPALTGRTINHTFVAGASEGGLVAALLAQENPGNRISGVLSACGPVGSFRKQINYFGDFRVLFDFFFPTVLPASPIAIPPSLISNWFNPGGGAQVVAAALQNNPLSAHLIATSGAATDPGNLSATTIQTAQEVLWYNVFATNEAAQELHGQPYDNASPFRFYVDPLSAQTTLRLNRPYPAGAQRFAATTSPAALAPYETTGRLQVPVVTLHTTGDDVVPFWQQSLYSAKLLGQGNLRKALQIPVFRYGHCNFTDSEIVLAFDAMVFRATGQFWPSATQHLDSDQVRKNFDAAAKEHPAK